MTQAYPEQAYLHLLFTLKFACVVRISPGVSSLEADIGVFLLLPNDMYQTRARALTRCQEIKSCPSTKSIMINFEVSTALSQQEDPYFSGSYFYS